MSDSNLPSGKRSMSRGKIIGLIAFGLAGMAVLSGVIEKLGPKPPSAEQSSNDRYAAEAAALTSTAHQIMLSRLRDPASAIFNYDLPRPLLNFCGTVKAKNGFGGYDDETYYMMFPFGLVTPEDAGPTRFQRLWDKFCVGDAPHANDYQKLANRPNELLSEATAADQAWMLGRWVGDSCTGSRAFFMGTGKAGISKGIAFWSVGCRRGRGYEVAISADGKGQVLDCAELAALHTGACFRRFTG